jgi:excisionase family DNA binding protein
MTIAEVAKLIGKSEQSVRRSIKSGKLQSTLVDGRYEINEDDITDSLRDSHR